MVVVVVVVVEEEEAAVAEAMEAAEVGPVSSRQSVWAMLWRSSWTASCGQWAHMIDSIRTTMMNVALVSTAGDATSSCCPKKNK